MERIAETSIVGGGVREFYFDDPFFSYIHLSLLAGLDASMILLLDATVDHVLETVDV